MLALRQGAIGSVKCHICNDRAPTEAANPFEYVYSKHMGSCASRFYENAIDVMYACTHGFVSAKFEFEIFRVSRRMAIMALALTEGYEFGWDLDHDCLILTPVQGGGLESAWKVVAKIVNGSIPPSQVWDINRSLNERLLACHKVMYAARDSRINGAQVQAGRPKIPIPTMDTLNEVVFEVSRRVCEDLLVGLGPQLSYMFKTRGPKGRVISSKRRFEKSVHPMLVELVPHAHEKLKEFGLERMARMVVDATYETASTFMEAERVMASVVAMTIAPDGRVSLGVRPVRTRALPDPTIAIEKIRAAVIYALDGAYEARQGAYIDSRKSALAIASAMVAAVAPLATENGARFDGEDQQDEDNARAKKEERKLKKQEEKEKKLRKEQDAEREVNGLGNLAAWLTPNEKTQKANRDAQMNAEAEKSGPVDPEGVVGKLMNAFPDLREEDDSFWNFVDNHFFSGRVGVRDQPKSHSLDKLIGVLVELTIKSPDEFDANVFEDASSQPITIKVEKQIPLITNNHNIDKRKYMKPLVAVDEFTYKETGGGVPAYTSCRSAA